MIEETLPATNPYTGRRRRANELAERYDFAAEVLGFYEQIAEIQERAYAEALRELPQPAQAAGYAAQHVLPCIVATSAQSGPAYLVQAVLERFQDADFEDLVRAWLHGEELDGVDRYLARAASAPVLEALGPAAADACRGTYDDRHCPRCGGLPQLSYFACSTEDLVTAHRYLLCARCAESWAFARMTCAFCGETKSANLPVISETEQPRYPHVRVDCCTSCSHYLLNVDLGRDRAAVPEVDEIAALPLDIYAKERGLQKIVPNAMGF